MRQKLWELWEIEYIKNSINDVHINDMMKVLNRSEKSIRMKIFKLKLKRPIFFVSQATIYKNKNIIGRNLSFEFVKKIAMECKTRSEFQRKDPSAYTAARKKEWLDEICSHMIRTSFSIPQLILKEILENIFKMKCSYNNRKIIKPYEIDVYFEKLNIGFEYHGKKWHIDKLKDIKKLKTCESKNIKLISIIENSRKYEIDIKSQLKHFLPEINEWCNMHIDDNDIESTKIDISQFNILDDKEIKKIVSNYIFLKDFMKENINLYNKLRKLKLNEKYLGNLKRLKFHKKNIS